jgi:isocitrate/isopropylmalate dehydrogenase
MREHFHRRSVGRLDASRMTGTGYHLLKFTVGETHIDPEGVSMFEPMGGSAPKYTGKNVINPLATISAGGMMMDTLGEPAIAKSIDKAIHDALASGQIKTLSAG